jgi:hypothetical protein
MYAKRPTAIFCNTLPNLTFLGMQMKSTLLELRGVCYLNHHFSQSFIKGSRDFYHLDCEGSGLGHTQRPVRRLAVSRSLLEKQPIRGTLLLSASEIKKVWSVASTAIHIYN